MSLALPRERVLHQFLYPFEFLVLFDTLKSFLLSLTWALLKCPLVRAVFTDRILEEFKIRSVGCRLLHYGSKVEVNVCLLIDSG